jgi:hypothetical protein
MIEVSMVPPQYIDTCWDKVEDFIGKAAKYTYGRYTTGNIYDMVKGGDYDLWVAYEEGTFKGAVVTNIITYPQKKILCMQFCGGEQLKLWKDQMLGLLQRFARDSGCEGIESTGRPGWAKVFKNDGYKATWITYELPIAQEK